MKIIKKFEQFEHDSVNKGNEVFTNVSDGGNFWGTVGAGILPICKETKRILIAYRSSYVNEPHTYGIWGGKLDDQETNDPKEGARVEFTEESGYNGNVELIDAFIFNKKNSEGNVVFTYHNYIGIIDEEFEPTLDWETESSKWVTLDELLSIPNKHFGLEALLNNSLDIIKSNLH